MGEELYYLGSVAVAALAICSAFVAYRAMMKGLTYSAMAAIMWAMVILAVGRTWHSTYEILSIPHEIGDSAELIEYAIYILAYGSFIWLSTRTRGLEKMPKSSSAPEQKQG